MNILKNLRNIFVCSKRKTVIFSLDSEENEDCLQYNTPDSLGWKDSRLLTVSLKLFYSPFCFYFLDSEEKEESTYSVIFKVAL